MNTLNISSSTLSNALNALINYFFNPIIIAFLIAVSLIIIVGLLSKNCKFYYCDQCGEPINLAKDNVKRELVYQGKNEIEHYYCQGCAKKMEAEAAKEAREAQRAKNIEEAERIKNGEIKSDGIRAEEMNNNDKFEEPQKKAG